MKYARLSSISDGVASRDGLTSGKGMLEELHRIYPSMKSDWVRCWKFKLVERLEKPVPKHVVVEMTIKLASSSTLHLR